jgi:hypothetical protein
VRIWEEGGAVCLNKQSSSKAGNRKENAVREKQKIGSVYAAVSGQRNMKDLKDLKDYTCEIRKVQGCKFRAFFRTSDGAEWR